MFIRQNGWECLQTSLFPTPRVECLDWGDNDVVSTFRVSVNWEVCSLWCHTTQTLLFIYEVRNNATRLPMNSRKPKVPEYITLQLSTSSTHRLTTSLTKKITNPQTYKVTKSQNHQLTNSLTQTLTTSSTHQLVNSNTHQPTNPQSQKLTNSLTQPLTNSSTSRLPNSNTHQFKNLNCCIYFTNSF